MIQSPKRADLILCEAAGQLQTTVKKDPSDEINHLLQISVRTQLGSDLNNLAAFNISKIKLL